MAAIARRHGTSVQGGPAVGVLLDGAADGFVGDQVGAGSAWGVVLGCGDQELAGCVEGVGRPAGGEHALAEDEVDVAAFPDAQADPDVHLRADSTGAHGLLCRALGCTPNDLIGRTADYRNGTFIFKD